MQRAMRLVGLLVLALAAACGPTTGVPRGGGAQEPLGARPGSPGGYCPGAAVPGPAEAPAPFLYQPFAGPFDPASWTAQMDHDQPAYRQNGVVAALGERLRYDASGPGLAGGTNAYRAAGSRWFGPDVGYPEVLQQGYYILAYQSPSFETYLYYDGHDGHDFAVTGQALAAADGAVAFKGDYGNSLGRVVEIYHPNGYLTRYAHLAGFAPGLEEGAAVKAGQAIGTIGGSAVVDGQLSDGYWGTHLHFSVFRWTGSAWHVTDPFGWDPWAGPDEEANRRRQQEDPLVQCNGEISYNLWAGGWPQPAGAAQAGSPFHPAQDRYVGGWLGEGVQEAAAPQTTPVALAIIGLDYTVSDVGDGWNEGLLRLGYENTGDEPLAPLCLILDRERAEMGGWSSHCPAESIEIEQVYVETAEGKTYPAEISPPAIEIGSPALDLPAPAHVPFQHIDIMMGYIFETARFRFAQAAHPTALVLQGAQEFRVDLTSVPAALPQPDLSGYAVRSVAELSGEPLLEPGGKVQGTLDGACWHQYVPSFYREGILVPYTLVNTNALDEEPYEMAFRHAIYYPGGLLRFFIDYSDVTFTLGPGQTEHGEVLLFDEQVDPDKDDLVESEDYVRASHLFVFSASGTVTVYALNCPEE